MKNLDSFDFLCKYSIFYEDCIISCEFIKYNANDRYFCITITGDILPCIRLYVHVSPFSITPFSCQYFLSTDICLYPDELIRWSPCIMHKVRSFDIFMRYVKISIKTWLNQYKIYSKHVL